MCSHILPEVARTADRVAVLLGGRLMGQRGVSAADTDLEDWFLSLA
jgi:ABC-type sugar transport system ATPase subunit